MTSGGVLVNTPGSGMLTGWEHDLQLRFGRRWRRRVHFSHTIRGDQGHRGGGESMFAGWTVEGTWRRRRQERGGAREGVPVGLGEGLVRPVALEPHL